jgi:hypothetical protein
MKYTKADLRVYINRVYFDLMKKGSIILQRKDCNLINICMWHLRAVPHICLKHVKFIHNQKATRFKIFILNLHF